MAYDIPNTVPKLHIGLLAADQILKMLQFTVTTFIRIKAAVTVLPFFGVQIKERVQY
jgi:hypothetical protein